MQWPLEEDDPTRETEEEKPYRLSVKACGPLEAKRREGFSGGSGQPC